MFDWPTFLTYAVLTTITPGPNTIMSMSNGSRRGFFRGIPLNLGMWCGFTIVMVGCAALTTQDGLAPKAFAITGARALRTACKLGLTIHIIGGLLGILIMLALAIVGSTHLLTPIHVLLYQLVWIAPGLLVSMWPRTV